MDSSQRTVEQPYKEDGLTVVGTENEKITEMAFQALLASQDFKQPRMNQIMKYERLYYNDITPKMRQMFNVPIPVFPGMIDTLLADFNDEMFIKFGSKNPAQYLNTPKIQAHWEAERDSLMPNASWNQKARWDRFNAALSGRGIMYNFTESKPYRNILEVINYSDFHCQPLGGGNLENHTFAGREGLMLTEADVMSREDFDKKQREKLTTFAFSSQWWTQIETTYGTRLQRFKSQGLDPETNSFNGTKIFNLCEFVITYEGVRYYIIFEPISKTWLKIEKWTDIRPSGLYPFISWATHEDHKVFWSKSYADDLYYIADSIITLFNQELTNREKKNYNARAFDARMFPDVAKLDEAQYRPDALVPVDLKPGQRIDNGLYTFQTAELQGTVNLINFMSDFTGRQVGVTQSSQGDTETSKKPTIVIEESKALSKRTGLRSDSYKEAYAKLGLAFFEGMREYMPPRLSVQIIGENGFIEEHQLKRIDVRRMGVPTISVSSTSEQETSDRNKREARIKAIQMVSDPNVQMNKYEKEVVLRDIGMFDDTEISFFLDSQNYESKKMIAHASEVIQAILLNRPYDVYYGADLSYLQYIETYMIDNRSQIKGKEEMFAKHLKEIAPIVQKNMERRAQIEGLKQRMAQQAQAQPQQNQQPQPQPQANAMPSTMQVPQKQA